MRRWAIAGEATRAEKKTTAKKNLARGTGSSVSLCSILDVRVPFASDLPGYARAERHLRHPDVGPVQERNPLGLRFLRRFRLARTVEGDRLANERLEGRLVNFFSFVDVDRAAYVSVEARVEEMGRIL